MSRVNLRGVIGTLAEKPWETGGFAPKTCHRSAGAVGLWVTLAVISSLFVLFMLSAIMRSQSPDWAPLTEQPWQPLFELRPLWINTCWLLASSAVLQLANEFPSQHRQSAVQLVLLAAALTLALAFMVGQWQVWQGFSDAGFGIRSGPSAGFYFLLTGLHALHLLVAIGVCCWLLPSLWGGLNALRLKLLTRYWHYLFLLWCVLFALISRPPATYKLLAALCGIEVSE